MLKMSKLMISNNHGDRWRARQPPPRPRATKRSDLYGFIKKTVVPFPRLG